MLEKVAKRRGDNRQPKTLTLQFVDPDPSAFLLHKLAIATHSARRNKKEKDIRQAVYTANFVLAEKSETAKLAELWAGLPKGWKAKIRRSLSQAPDILPLEKEVIERLQYLLE